MLLLFPASHIYSPVSMCEAVQEFALNKIIYRNENSCSVIAKITTEVTSLTVVK
jgi:hypothetical protein